MAQNKRFDLTEGRVVTKLIQMAFPIMGIQLFQMLFNLIDMFLLGRISSDAVAASGTAGMFVWLSVAFLVVGGMGAELGVAHRLGEKRPGEAIRFSQNGTLLALVFGCVYGAVLIFFSPQLIRVLGVQEANVVADGAAYLAILGIGMPFNFITSALSGTYKGAGNSKFSSLVIASGLAFNIVLTPFFIYAFGIRGAAAATVISQFYIMCAFFVSLKCYKNVLLSNIYYGIYLSLSWFI